MSEKAGALLWRRMRLTLNRGATDVDTGITQLGKNFADQSPGEPPLGIGGPSAPPPGSTPASRVEVVPLAPLLQWNLGNITHGDPYFNTTTGTVHVVFNSGGEGPLTINAFFWDPHTLVGPGEADPYTDPQGV